MAADDSVTLTFLFLEPPSSSKGKLIREKTLAFCFRSAAAAAAAAADAVGCAAFDDDLVTGSDDFLDEDLATGSDDFLDLVTGSDDFPDEASVR